MLTKTKWYIRDLKVKGSITLPFHQFHSTQLKHSLNLRKGWLNTGTGCPARLCCLHSWRYSNPEQRQPRASKLPLLWAGLDWLLSRGACPPQPSCGSVIPSNDCCCFWNKPQNLNTELQGVNLLILALFSKSP